MDPLNYYKKAHKTDSIIKKRLVADQKEANPDEEIVYGARSVNVRLPDFLQKYTEDWDIYSKNAEQTAKEIEKDLDKYFGGNYFEVKPAKHEGTFKVISRVTERGVADITLPEKVIKYDTIRGIKYATLDEQVINIKKTLADPASQFRHRKDRETLQRIKLSKKIKKTKKRKPVYPSIFY